MKTTKTILGGQDENGSGAWSTVTHVISDDEIKSDTVATKLYCRGKLRREMEGAEGRHILEGLAEIWNRDCFPHNDPMGGNQPDWTLWHNTNGNLIASGAQPIQIHPTAIPAEAQTHHES